MNTYADNNKENSHHSMTKAISHKKDGTESPFQFVEIRPEVSALRKLQQIAGNSHQTKKVAQLKSIAKNSFPIQFRLQAKPSSWNPLADPTPFFNSVRQSLNNLTSEGALNYLTTGKIYKTLNINRGAVIDDNRPQGTRLVYRMIDSEKTITIKDINSNLNAAEPEAPGWFVKNFRSTNSNKIEAHKAAARPGEGTNVRIDWNPNLAEDQTRVPVLNPENNRFELQTSPPHITLGHELGHADRFSRGVGKVVDPETGRLISGGFRRRLNDGREVTKNVITAEEVYNIGLIPANLENLDINHMVENPDAENTITENDLRNEQGLAARVGYGMEVTDDLP